MIFLLNLGKIDKRDNVTSICFGQFVALLLGTPEIFFSNYYNHHYQDLINIVTVLFSLLIINKDQMYYHRFVN